jgi:uncharacterized protein involved in exopolysaccharide biosynthesis
MRQEAQQSPAPAVASLDDDTIDPADLALILWRRKGFLAASTLSLMIAGAAYLWQAQPAYQVEARILVERQQPPAAATEPAGRETEQDKNFLATQAEIIRSPAVVGRAVQRLGLRAPDGFEADPVTSIIGSLSVAPVLGTNVLRIGFRSPDPAEAARTVEGLVDTYRQYVLEGERQSQATKVQLLSESERKLRGEFQSLHQAYQARHRGESVAVQPAPAPAGEGISLVSHSAVGDPAEAQPASFASVELADVPQADPNERWNAAAIEAELAKAEVHRAELSRSFGPKHPALRAADEQIETWKRLLRERLEAAPLQRLKTAHDEVLVELQASEKAEQALAVGQTGLAIGMLQAPSFNGVPVGPPRSVLLGACGLVGLIGGLGLTWLMERSSPSLARPSGAKRS